MARLKERNAPTLPAALIAPAFYELAMRLCDANATRYDGAEVAGRDVLYELLKMQSAGEQQRPAAVTVVDWIDDSALDIDAR